ncbi:DHHC zinc finger domain containing protein [Tritrichomonas foetus]|uniref:Palmitoyltransferase n=1 Tax=Tritrichomonas foetus TaxID=1144522 RepID=A0A1J4KK86_9EUKA|nr:DHHC zinc finger domain containing protein [Tritrichomonas foetus]|eukprot:OHT11711.1 DHHC zinc finger domain containing protein [Tritrichomonas foetus]
MKDEIPLVDKSPKAKRKRSFDFPDDPPVTEWLYICPGRCFPLTKLKNYNRFFFREIEIEVGSLVILFVLGLIGFTYCVFFTSVLPQFHRNVSLFALIETTIITFLFLWSYLSASCMDPGYLPYYWYQTQNDWYPWEEQLSGLATTETQCVFVDMHERPNNAAFSRSAGRFVIRGDHICDWICNWVGKRNHKQFFLLIIYGSLYCLSMIFWTLFVKSSKVSQLRYSLIVVSLVLEIVFAFALIITFVSRFIMVLSNQTQIQVYKNQIPEPKESWIESLEEICGPGTKLCWFIPTPAFGKELPNPTRI